MPSAALQQGLTHGTQWQDREGVTVAVALLGKVPGPLSHNPTRGSQRSKEPVSEPLWPSGKAFGWKTEAVGSISCLGSPFSFKLWFTYTAI